MKATGRIEVTSYEPTTWDDAGGPKLLELHITETFTGDIVGDGKVRFLQALRADGSASFCGIERVTGTLAGKRGTFLLQDAGTLVGQDVRGEWFVVPGSATGELAGLRGEGGFTAKLGAAAEYWLEVRFE